MNATCWLVPLARLAREHSWSSPLSALAQTVVTMWTFLDPAKTTGREVALKGMIESFEKANPGIKIKVEPQVFSELMAKFLAAHNTGAAPDIIWVNTENMGALVKSGAAADLNELFLKQMDEGARTPTSSCAPDGIAERRAASATRCRCSTRPRASSTARTCSRKPASIPASIKTWDQLVGGGEEADARRRQGRPHRRLGLRHAAVDRAHRRHHCVHDDARRRRQALGRTARRTTPSDVGVRAVQLHVDMINKHNVMPKESDRQSRRRHRRPVHRGPLRHRRDAVRALLAGAGAGEVGRRQPRRAAVAELDRRQARPAAGAGLVGRPCGASRRRTKEAGDVPRVDDQPGFGARVDGHGRAGADAHVGLEGAGAARSPSTTT